MAEKPVRADHVTLRYPRHALEPEDMLDFVQLPGFDRDWKKLGLSSDDLFALRVAITSNPTCAPVISGTGGVRKVRFAPIGSNRGKSGGARVWYAYFPEVSMVLLLAAYSKNRKQDLTPVERRNIRRAVKDVQEELERGPIE
jgi:hypothetical protein